METFTACCSDWRSLWYSLKGYWKEFTLIATFFPKAPASCLLKWLAGFVHQNILQNERMYGGGAGWQMRRGTLTCSNNASRWVLYIMLLEGRHLCVHIPIRLLEPCRPPGQSPVDPQTVDCRPPVGKCASSLKIGCSSAVAPTPEPCGPSDCRPLVGRWASRSNVCVQIINRLLDP